MASTAYVLLLEGLLLVTSLLWLRKGGVHYAIAAGISIFVICSFIGLRSTTSGVDTFDYYTYFTSKDVVDQGFEPGFVFITKVLRFVFSAELYFLFIAILQGAALVLAGRMLGIKNSALTLIAFLSFIPGLDLFSNAVRNGLALTIGMPLLVGTAITGRRFKYLNLLPATIHLSYGLISAISFTVRRFASVKSNVILFVFSILFCFLGFRLSSAMLASHLDSVPKGYVGISQIIKYMLLENELLSDAVKLYFAVVSLLFSIFYFIVLGVDKASRQDIVLTRLAYVSLSIQLCYMIVSFSEYAFRFMFIAYPLQILMFVYVAERYIKVVWRVPIVILVLTVNIAVTYSTNTYATYQLLDIF